MLPMLTDFDQIFRAFERDLSNLFGRAVTGWPYPFGAADRRLVPAMEVARTDGQLVIAVEMPGVDPDSVEATVEGGILTIRGERKPAVEGEGVTFLRRELAYGTYERQLALPDGADAERIEAHYDHGILRVTVPVPQAAARKIPVQVAAGERKQLKAS